MAFIRKRQSSWRKRYTWYSFQLIESYREGGKVRQRVLCNIGTARSAAQVAQRYGARVPEQYRDEVLRKLEAMASREPAADDDGETLEALERRIEAARRA
jgi:hypothetical protein